MIFGGGIGLNRMSMFLHFRFRQRAGNRPTRQLLSSPPAAAAFCGPQFRLISSYSGLYNPQKRPNAAFHRSFCHRPNKKRFFTVKLTWLCARCKPSGYPLQSSLLGSAFFIRVNTSLLTNK